MSFIGNYKHILSLLVLSGVVLLSSGCGPTKNDIDAFLKPYQVNTTSEVYVLQPPDVIKIQSAKIPEIHQLSQQIRPDGKVSFEGLGEIEVAGKTPAEAGVLIRKKAESLYALTGDNPVDVQIETYGSKVFYVLGEVRRPGPQLYTGRNTALNAVATAHPEVTAWIQRIKVTRPSAKEEVEGKSFEIDLMAMMDQGDTSRNVLLEEGDIIYIRPTPLAAVANVLAEFLRPIGLALSPYYQAAQIQNMSN